MSTRSIPALLQQACNLYFFGQTDSAQIEKETNLHELYNQEEIDELELDTKKIEKKSNNIFLHLNTDWDSFPGSVRNSAASLFDAFFSSLGSRITEKLNSYSKLGITAGTFLTAITANRLKLPLLSNKISIFNYAGRLLRAPFHIFDSSFSAIGESWSQSSIANICALGSGVLGLTNSIN